MLRISSNMMADNLVNISQRNTERMLGLQNNVATGVKHRVPREDPIGVSHSMTYDRALFELGQFGKNVDDGISRLNVAETALAGATDILQRVRELGLQGANGIYTKEDRAKIATEIDQLLNELVHVANTQYKGRSIFAGNDTLDNPFKAVRTYSKYAGKEVIQQVEYLGDMGPQNREISRGNIVAVNVPGNEVFWAEQSSLFSSVDATNYVLPVDSRVRLNGVTIGFKAGDNIEMIVNRINGAPVPVRASVNRMNGGIILETSSARAIMVEDIQGSTLMQDIGVISGRNAPQNLSPTARVFGGTLFDMVMRVRDSLYMDDVEDAGSRAIGGVDLALENVLKYRTELGARANRLDMVKARIIQDTTNMEDILSKNEDVDLAEAITNLRMLELVHRSALGVTARVIQPTLLDFLR
jgi:flagellar hook-associated protein 3 FlgL